MNAAIQVLRERLPPRWRVTALPGSGATIRITSHDGRSCDLPTVIKCRIDPRSASALRGDTPLLVVAPYLSQSVQGVLNEQGTSFVDQTGNVRLVVEDPGLFVVTAGAEKNPWPNKRRLSLRGKKAGRVVRALVSTSLPIGVRALANLAGTDPGYVSRLLSMLDREALVERSLRGRVEGVAWRKLLERWSEGAPLEKRAEASTWLAPRGLKGVFERLQAVSLPYLVTGSAAATRVAPVAPTRLASIYVDDLEDAVKALGLREADAGANVILLLSDDDALYAREQASTGVRYAPLSLVVVDLLTGPGRSPAQAEALMDWMAENEEVWRG